MGSRANTSSPRGPHTRIVISHAPTRLSRTTRIHPPIPETDRSTTPPRAPVEPSGEFTSSSFTSLSQKTNRPSPVADEPSTGSASELAGDSRPEKSDKSEKSELLYGVVMAGDDALSARHSATASTADAAPLAAEDASPPPAPFPSLSSSSGRTLLPGSGSASASASSTPAPFVVARSAIAARRESLSRSAAACASIGSGSFDVSTTVTRMPLGP
mmetsp:Transcript_3980/g.16220  ORF Transcript_3980/g.16220 Transcript_3980/m.16220 type:complete len:215 (-) Transcript_3980:1214-1858(-)